MARRRGAAARSATGLLLVVLALAACSAGAPQPDDARSPSSSATTATGTDPGTTTANPAPAPGPDARGVLPPVPERPETRWLLPVADVDVGDAADLTFHDPRHPPTIDGWPMVGVLSVGDVWVVGVADVGSDRRWLLALDPAVGTQLATIGLTRGDGPPSSCTDALADGTVACLYGDSVEVLDPNAGTAVGRLTLDEPAHSAHAVDGDVVLLGFAPDGSAVRLTRLGVTGPTQWSVSVDLDEQEALATAGNHLPVVQSVPGLLLVGVGGFQLAVDVDNGTPAWQGMADVLAPGPDGGLVASSRGEPGWGIPSRLEWLDAAANTTRTTEELSWWPAAANSGLVPGPVVADAGDAVVGVSPDGTQVWRVPADDDELRVPMVRADGVVVLQDTAGSMTAIEPATGSVRWRNDSGSLGWGARGWSALTDGERMVARSPDGVIAVDLTDGSLAWEVPLLAADAQVWELVDLGDGLVAAGERVLTAFTVPAS